MNTRTKCFTSFTLLLLCLALGCNVYETDKANELINAGNAAVTEANQLFEAANSKADKLSDSLNSEQLEDNDSIKGLAQEAAAACDKSAAKYREGATKFDQASKLKLQDQLKEYLTLKSREFSKHAEQADVVKSIMEGGDAETILKKIGENRDRINQIEKEAIELAEKSTKIQQENKSIFKPESK
ncbi:MAG TPA: hypothetical protein VLR90_03860 [Blastocatellia bacterium]|nr:hypothetical protein [Blastocatellia bacterium]